MYKDWSGRQQYGDALLNEYYLMAKELDSLKKVGDNRLTSKRYAVVSAQMGRLRTEMIRIGIQLSGVTHECKCVEQAIKEVSDDRV